MPLRTDTNAGRSPLRRAYAFVGERGYACDILGVDGPVVTVRFARAVDLPPAIDFQVVGRPTHTRAVVRWQKGAEAGLSIEAPVQAVHV